jgi:hypothetical protein
MGGSGWVAVGSGSGSVDSGWVAVSVAVGVAGDSGWVAGGSGSVDSGGGRWQWQWRWQLTVAVAVDGWQWQWQGGSGRVESVRVAVDQQTVAVAVGRDWQRKCTDRQWQWLDVSAWADTGRDRQQQQ